MSTLSKIANILLIACPVAAPCSADADGPKRAVLVIETDLLADEAVASAVERYAGAVQSRFGYHLLVDSRSADTNAQQIRETLLSLHGETRGLSGVLLVGAFPFARFENAIGERGIFPEYFQDLDGTIEDTDKDGVFDRYDPWVDDSPPLELWLATFRPYATSPKGESARQQTVRFFERGHGALRSDSAPPKKCATIFTTKDWSNQDTLMNALKSRYGQGAALMGVDAESSSREQFLRAAKRDGDLLFVFAHSGPTAHHLDSPEPPQNLVVPTSPARPRARGPLALDEVGVRADTVVLWACSILDLDEIDRRDTPLLANSYILGEESSCRTLLGAARSIGMENLPFLIERIDADRSVFPEAWLAYQNSVYDREFLTEWLGVRNAWEKERERFNWSYLIYGDPFARLAR